MLLLAFCRAALNVGSVRWLEEGSESRQQGTQKQEVGAGTKTESLRPAGNYCLMCRCPSSSQFSKK